MVREIWSRGGAARRTIVLLGLVGVAFLLAPSTASAQQVWPCEGSTPLLTVDVESPAMGTVSASDPNGCLRPPNPTCSAARCVWPVEYFCEAHCQHNHTGPSPSRVTLVANPLPGYFFAGLVGCDRGDTHAVNECSVRVNGAKNVRARFSPLQDTDRPTAPALTGTAGSYDATLNWTAANDTVWVGGYNIRRNNQLLTRVGSGATTFKVINLLCDHQYVFQVEAFDAGDNAAPSNELVLRTGRCGAGGGGGGTPAPNTILHTHPAKVTRSRTARFHWGSNQQRVTYQCKLDRQAWRACRPGKTYRNLKKGVHTFRVRARNAAGRVDPTPAIWRWRIR